VNPHPFSTRTRIRFLKSSESSFDVDLLAKPEVNSNIKRKRITRGRHSLPTTPTNLPFDLSMNQIPGFTKNLNLDSVKSNTALVMAFVIFGNIFMAFGTLAIC